MIYGNVSLYIHTSKRDIPEGTSTEEIMSGWSDDDTKINDIKIVKCDSVRILCIVPILTNLSFVISISQGRARSKQGMQDREHQVLSKVPIGG